MDSDTKETISRYSAEGSRIHSRVAGEKDKEPVSLKAAAILPRQRSVDTEIPGSE